MSKLYEGIDVLRNKGIKGFTQKLSTYLYERYREVLFKTLHRGGVNVMEEDWDNLLLLDACRFNTFRKVNDLNGRLEKRLSRGSMSREFIENNFFGGQFHDTVYVTANPYVKDIKPGTFHAVISLLDEWNKNHQTVTPDTVKKAVEEASREYNDKRIIAHFMQPHQPYLGNKANEIEARTNAATEVQDWNTNPRYASEKVDKNGTVITHQEAAKRVDIDVSDKDLRSAYRETLEIALEKVKQLLDILNGKTIISSDHGELLGERCCPLGNKRYGHPRGSYAPELRKVPWFVIMSGQRRNISSGEPERYKIGSSEHIDSRLKQLGYR